MNLFLKHVNKSSKKAKFQAACNIARITTYISCSENTFETLYQNQNMKK